MRASVVLALVLWGASPASAEWLSRASEDPLTDEKTAILIGTNGDVSIGAKCWVGDPNATMIMVGMGVRHDAAASYPDRIPLQLRVDKGDISSLTFSPAEVGGDLTLVSSGADTSEVVATIKRWAEAKTNIVVGFPNKAETIPARGSTKAVSRFIENCGF